jgi:antitoxin MazE
MYLHGYTSGATMKTAKSNDRVGLLVSKWGNSLAVRLPAESLKQLGVGEGDTLIGEISPEGRLVLSAEARAVGKADTKRMRQFLSRQKMTAPVVREMRRRARY